MLGILTGISYVSGLDYYRSINEQVTAAGETGFLMAPNPPMVLVSMDCDVYAHHLTEGTFADVADYLLEGVTRLVDAGCDWMVIASNTAHLSVPVIEDRFPDLPVLHIADCCARELRARGHQTTGLIGTKPTMEADYLKGRFHRHGIDAIVPEPVATRDEIFRIIHDELSFGRFEPGSRAFVVSAIEELASRSGAACVSGCTEIELLVRQEHVPHIDWLPSAELHVGAIVDVLLGRIELGDLLP